MNKDFSEAKLVSFDEAKIIKVLYDLSSFIEANDLKTDNSHFEKLTKYHFFLKSHNSDKIQKLNKEFTKVKSTDYQWQVYLMNLERILGLSSKEYDFLVETKDKKEPQKIFPIVCLLDSVRSAHNVGAMFRNAECFGAEKIILSGLSPTPELEQVKKTSMGTHTNISWSYEKKPIDIIKDYKTKGYKVIAIETSRNAKNLNSIKSFSSPCIFIFGHEHFGVSLELIKLSDDVLSIPMFGQKNSLNVSVSQGIILNKITSIYDGV